MNMIERRDGQMAYISDDEVVKQQKKCRRILQKFNRIKLYDYKKMRRVISRLFGKCDGAFVNPPFHCDYGKNIEVGKNFYANFNCTILDVAKVRIGDNVFLAPNVGIYTAGHPVHPFARNLQWEYGKEITIGDNVWIGGSVVVCPGVKIGSNVVIGAGSVVVKDIPDWCVAAGNPCKVIRKISDEDKDKLFKNETFDKEAWDLMNGDI